MAIVRYTSEEIKEELKKRPSRTDWERLRNMRDEDIDCSDSPDISELLEKGLVRIVPREYVWNMLHGKREDSSKREEALCAEPHEEYGNKKTKQKSSKT